jgi:hypothetical protein
VREWRTRTRLRKTLVDERTSWLQRIQATLFHHGIGGVPDQLLRVRGRAFLAELELPAARERIEVALEMIDALDRQLAPLERDIRALARRQAGCRELMRHYGIGPVTATSIVAELGDVSRLSASRKAVRCAGLAVGVHRSDQYSRLGKLTRQGSPQLRWALYEAAQPACKPRSPHHGDYLELKARGLSHTRATMTIARKLARRCFHSLRKLGPAALEPATQSCTRTDRFRQAHRSPMTPKLPAGSHKCCDTRPQAAIPKRPSGRSRSPRIDRATITSPATRPSTQISPGARGTTALTTTAELHNHSPPTLTTAPVQISSTVAPGSRWSSDALAAVASSEPPPFHAKQRSQRSGCDRGSGDGQSRIVRSSGRRRPGSAMR